MQPLSDTDHRNPLKTLTLLNFTYNEWNWSNSPQPQFRNFCHWMKQSILHQNPVLFGIYLPEMNFDDYDHIVPAIGICYQNENQYDQDDVLIYYDLYSKDKIKKYMNEEEFGSTRKTINNKIDANDGCLPLDVNYLFFYFILKN